MRRIPAALRKRIELAARYRCGYCLTPQTISGAQMEIDHIVPVAAGGLSAEANLWLACAWCNSHKGAQTHAADPETGAMVPLFNPRTQPWAEHFRWNVAGDLIEGITPIGRATVIVLQLNNPYIIPARRQWVIAGWHPPSK